jgi:hypothetical protein
VSVCLGLVWLRLVHGSRTFGIDSNVLLLKRVRPGSLREQDPFQFITGGESLLVITVFTAHLDNITTSQPCLSSRALIDSRIGKTAQSHGVHNSFFVLLGEADSVHLRFAHQLSESTELFLRPL